MDELEFRRILPEDMEKWFSLRIESLKNTPSAFLASPETDLEKGSDFFKARIVEGGDSNLIFGCFDKNELVGTVGIVRETHLKAKHKAFIWGMYVNPEYRGKKIGEKLLQQTIEFGKTVMKVEQINIAVETTRKSAKQLYTKMGFVKWGTESKAMFVEGQYFDEDFMKLEF